MLHFAVTVPIPYADFLTVSTAVLFGSRTFALPNRLTVRWLNQIRKTTGMRAASVYRKSLPQNMTS
jgi:hypothetical protein